MSEVPADKDVRSRNGCNGDVEHVVTKAWSEHTMSLIRLLKLERLIGDLEKLRSTDEEVGVKLANGRRRQLHFRRGHRRQ